MQSVIRIEDSKVLLPTRLFPYAEFDFEHFNPVQSRFFDVFEKDANHCLATNTGSGKTAAGEMTLSYAIRNQKKKGMYIVPYRSIAQEKINKWTSPDHHFSDLKISICTGDYFLTEARKKELSQADLIIITSEMLASRCRNANSEKNDFFKDVQNVVADEAHLLTIPGRGDHLEVALMKMSELNPDVRFTLLSATMPNVDEICRWVSSLNNKNTYLLESKYRPCKLNLHYVPYWDGNRNYYDNEEEKVDTALNLVQRFPKDKFLIFAHTKDTGRQMVDALNRVGINAEFHNASLEKEKRLLLEDKFRNDSKFRVIVATSTLSTGVNTPARRVIILGVHRAIKEVPVYEIMQEYGRAGRPGYDPVGDAYILLPEGKKDIQESRLQTPERIESQLLEYVGSKDDEHRSYKALAFHLISEIHHKNIVCPKDVYKWYKRSFSHYQAKDLDADIVDNVIDMLVNCGSIKIEDDEFKVTSVGAIASMFYYSPFDIADFKKQFTVVFDEKQEKNDFAIAVALGNTDTNRLGFVSRAEKEEMAGFTDKIHKLFGINSIMDCTIKSSYCYYMLMNGKSSGIFNSMMRGYQFDFPRTSQVLQAIDGMAAKWNRTDYINQLKLRVQLGVKGELVELCQLPNIAAVRAQKLWNAKIRTISDVSTNPDAVRKATNLSAEKVKEIVAAAKAMKLEALI